MCWIGRFALIPTIVIMHGATAKQMILAALNAARCGKRGCKGGRVRSEMTCSTAMHSSAI
jgi:hypothetical protein